MQTDKEKVSERITYLVTERQADRDIGRKCKKEKKMSETHTQRNKYKRKKDYVIF